MYTPHSVPGVLFLARSSNLDVPPDENTALLGTAPPLGTSSARKRTLSCLLEHVRSRRPLQHRKHCTSASPAESGVTMANNALWRRLWTWGILPSPLRNHAVRQGSGATSAPRL